MSEKEIKSMRMTLLKRARMNLSWIIHLDRFRVPRTQKKQYRNIFTQTWRRLSCNPSIFKSDDFGNKIKWLMLFDQDPEIIRCSDKIAVREYVKEAIGENYLNRVFGVWDNAKEINFEDLPGSFVLKTNHDSGSVWVVPDKERIDKNLLRDEVAKSLARTYGVEKGEWCYQHIQPQAFAEEFLDAGSTGIEDYKFHCCSGRVNFLQYLYDRHKGKPKEEIVLRSGEVTDIIFTQDFTAGNRFKLPPQWDELVMVAEKLSKPFKYVRVDLYLVNGNIRFGELTFYPKNGNYKSDDQKKIGKWLKISRHSVRSPYVG